MEKEHEKPIELILDFIDERIKWNEEVNYHRINLVVCKTEQTN